jgi:hypothetical protein
MRTTNTCCGSNLRKRITTVKTPLLPNPKIPGGIAVIYLGSGNISVKGTGSASVYHASDHNRHFRIYTEDADSILKRPDIILKP